MTFSDAMDFYDNHVIQSKGADAKASDLNIPEKWRLFIEGSESEGEREDSTKETRKSKKQSR